MGGVFRPAGHRLGARAGAVRPLDSGLPVIDCLEVYADVRPVSAFPMDAAQRVLGAGCDADALILGQGPRHAWRYRDGGWGATDLTA